MQFSRFSSRTGAIVSVLIAGVGLAARGGQSTHPQYGQKDEDKTAEAKPVEAKSIPPRAGPSDYQARAKPGDVTIAADFWEHAVPTPEVQLSTEEYVVVEVAMFGPPDKRLKLSYEDFSLRINAKKNPTRAEAYTLVLRSIKDPNYDPPELAQPKSSATSVSANGRGGADSSGSTLPPVVHIPLPLERARAQRVQKAALPEDEHVLPQAGLLFFPHRGKIQSVELIYTGPAGKATLTLQP
jgi:hypothetical protein